MRIYTKEQLARGEFEETFYNRKEALAFARKKRKEGYEAKTKKFDFGGEVRTCWVVSGRKKKGGEHNA